MTDNDTISRQAVKKVLKDWYENLIVGSLNGLIKRIDAIPSTEPQIIRCKDCKHHGYDRRDLPYCNINDYGYGWKDEDFCSYAERKGDG